MKNRKGILMVVCAAVTLAVSACSCDCKTKMAVPMPSQEEFQTMTDRANDFAFSFYKRNSAGKNENFFFSPYSMRRAFSMVRTGAAGGTAEELNKVFMFSEETDAVKKEAAALAMAAESAAHGTVFRDANSLWTQKDFSFLPEYISGLKKYYSAWAGTADFAKDSASAVKKINDWTAKNTNGIIKNLFSEGAVNSLTRMVLVNAVYFKGSWEKAFAKTATFEADFHLSAGGTTKARLMRHEDETDFPYASDSGVQYLAMPYRNGGAGEQKGLEMMIILPSDRNLFTKAEKNLSAEKIRSIRESMHSEKVRVFLPKFSFEASHELKNLLMEMGMSLSFTDKADFSGMTGDKSLFIQTAVQKAFIDASEEGTEAAAATGMSMGLKSIPRPSVIFRADRPFIFLIRDAESGLVLFMGKVESPKA
jgi:serpin B